MLPIRKRKSIGQHLIKDKELIEKICDLIVYNLPHEEFSFFEIGPGEGNITIPLLKKLRNSENKPSKIILNEIDYRYLKKLKEKIEEEKINQYFNIEFITQEFQKVKFKEKRIFLFGNIPFYITGTVFKKLIQDYDKVVKVVINLQKEVVDKILNLDNPLGVSFNIGWNIVEGMIIHPSFYDPPPKVFSQIILLENKHNPLFCLKFVNFLHKIYRNKKKMLKNILTEEEISKIKDESLLSERPFNLKVNQIVQLYENITKC